MAKQTRLTQARKAINKAAAVARAAQRREKLIVDHIHVVDRITEQVARKMTHLDPEDLRQAGFVGLVQAADRYKRKNGVFSHYCYFRIRGEMFDAHKRSAYRDDVLFLNSIDEMRDDADGSNLPNIIVIDRGPLPDAIAAKREQARLLAEALGELDIDEQRVFLNSLRGIALITTAQECGKPVSWARMKLASARLQLGARVQMWDLGLHRGDPQKEKQDNNALWELEWMVEQMRGSLFLRERIHDLMDAGKREEARSQIDSLVARGHLRLGDKAA